jgi:hypothetical protein
VNETLLASKSVVRLLASAVRYDTPPRQLDVSPTSPPKCTNNVDVPVPSLTAPLAAGNESPRKTSPPI